MKTIGITGGIGSGKSVVSKILTLKGIDVYDCDSMSKKIQETSTEVIEQTIELLGKDSYIDGKLNRQYIASKVFSDKCLLVGLNNIVHPAVKKDFDNWRNTRIKKGSIIVGIESAILNDAKLNNLVDEVWVVKAPIETRISRACKRDNANRQQIEARIRNQKEATGDYEIINDDHHSLLMQINNRLEQMNVI